MHSNGNVKSKDKQIKTADNFADVSSKSGSPDLEDPKVVLSLLEADQVVAAKQRTQFGRRNLSLGVRILLWGLRVYVLVMLVLVLITAIRAVHPAP